MRLRALKRHYRDLCAKDGSKDGRLPSRYLADGYKELLRLAGRETELANKSPAFFEAFVARAPSDTVDWEAFMLLVMLDEQVYHEELVETLRAVFRAFDSDGAGYVELSDLGSMMASAYHAIPTDAEVQAKLAFFAADPTMTATWDEFLLMMHDHGPLVGELGSFHTATPLTRVRSLHH